MNDDAINWFEIPVNDLDRALRFYETVLDQKLRRETFAGTPMAVFPTGDPGVGGALVPDARRPARPGGVIVYLNAAGKLDACLARVEASGGAVLLPKTPVGEPGFIALVRDSEGNTVGLHSP